MPYLLFLSGTRGCAVIALQNNARNQSVAFKTFVMEGQ